MKRRNFLQTAALTSAIPICGVVGTDQEFRAKTPALSTQEQDAIAAALGKKGSYNQAQATYNVPLPRNDLKMKVKGEAVPISFGFGGWVAFKKTLDGKDTMLMSDTVLLQEEVNPLISAAQGAGLEISAIHNHFFYEEPRIFYMHLHGMGAAADLARMFADAIRSTRLFPANQPAPSDPSTAASELFDLAALDAVVGHKGAANGSTYKYTVGRDDLTIKAMGAELTAAIGLNSWASFAGSRENAHIAGDIAMLDYEVNPVIKALRANGLEVVALHNHLLGDDPHMIFLHYYGRGLAPELARGFRSALDQLGKGKGKGE
ncbi:MAG: DUF1259 domain-containing protein [Bacteroidetes bacterium]|nr:DUF1259 domain-containing protein [Bacteroidota bacterium]